LFGRLHSRRFVSLFAQGYSKPERFVNPYHWKKIHHPCESVGKKQDNYHFKVCILLGMTMKQKLMRPGPSEIVYKNMKFLIMDRPTDATIGAFIEELKRKNVTEVVRVCEPTYKKDALETYGINVLYWQFDDGSPPPAKIMNDWFDLLRKKFKENNECYIAVHCVAGLGRAPVLVAIALIELGMRYEDAVELIRQKRRGAINAKQLSFLEKYRPKSRLKSQNGLKQCCIQ